MASYHTPKPRDTRVADLIGLNVAVRKGETKIGVLTKNGPGDVIIGDTYVLTVNGAEPKGDVWYWNQYLREDLEPVTEGRWFVGKVVKPDTAYYWADVDPALQHVASQLIDGEDEGQW